MPDRLVIEQFHLTVFVPRGLPPDECRAVRRALAGRGFAGRLRRAAEAVAARDPSLRRTTIEVSR